MKHGQSLTSIASRPLVSIVMPVFNVEIGIFQSCLSSVVGQEYLNVEVIVVDDGSESRFSSAYKRMCSLYDNVNLITQDNYGASSARNRGVELATGDYVMFADADDVLLPHAVSEAMHALIHSNADMAIGGIREVVKEEVGTVPQYTKEGCQNYLVLQSTDFDSLRNHYVALDDPQLLSITGGGFVNRGPYCRLIKHSLAIKNPFPEGLPIGEDIIWNLSMLDLCERVCIVDDVWYIYQIHENSTLHRYRGDRIEAVTRYLEELRRRNGVFWRRSKDKVCKLLYTELYRIIVYELMASECMLTIREKSSVLRTLLKKEPWRLLRTSSARKSLSARQYLLVRSCATGLWLPLVNGYLFWRQVRNGR